MLHELPVFDHIAVKDIEEALFWLRKDRERTRVIAGGTDLLGLMKDRVEGPRFAIPNVLVDIKSIRGVQDINDGCKQGLTIGASVPLSRLAAHETTTGKFPLLVQAAGQVGTTQIRNVGTIAGNLCQRPRCLYFRHPHFLCRKKGGDRCFASAGEHRYNHSILGYRMCSAACLSDLSTALATLRATAVIVNSEGNREVPISEFFSPPDLTRETGLELDELLKEIRIPWPASSTYQVFLKHRIRHSVDFALVNAAVAVRILEDGTCADAAIFLGAIAPFPYRFSRAEDVIRGRRLSRDLIREASRVPLEEVRALPENGYKVGVARTLVERALECIAHQSISTRTRAQTTG